MHNQNPEQIARDAIDAQLGASGWSLQDKNAFNPNDGEGQAVREYISTVLSIISFPCTILACILHASCADAEWRHSYGGDSLNESLDKYGDFRGTGIYLPREQPLAQTYSHQFSMDERQRD